VQAAAGRGEGGVMVIFTGSGRCGTKTVADLFGISHEWNKWSFIKGWWDNRGVTEPPWETASEKYDRLFRHLDCWSLCNRLRFHYFADSSNYYVWFLEELLEMDAGAKVVLLARHPVGFVESSIARNCHLGTVFGLAPNRDADPVAFALWDIWNAVQRCSWIWVKRNTAALSVLEHCHCPIIHIEDLYGPGTIRDIEDYTGLKANEALKQQRHHVHKTDPESLAPLTPEELVQVQELCFPTMQRLGYVD